MPSRSTVVIFVLGIIAVIAAAWLLLDLSLKMTVGFFLSMLLGGSLYFLSKARE